MTARSGPVRVLLADDHGVVRAGLKLLLTAQPDIEVIGEADDGLAAWEQTCALQPDILVLDVAMPGLSGIEVQARVQAACPAVKVVFLTMHEDPQYLHQLLQVGAAGCVLKRAAAQELIQAIRAVAAGGIYLDPTLTAQVLQHYRQAPAPAPPAEVVALSAREEAVLRRIAAGYSNKEIAVQLSLSVKTVETYKARLLDKLGLTTRAEIVRYAAQRGWLPGAE
jgi:two-component system response regulator NreC